MIGDSLNDAEAGRNAGCKVVYIGDKKTEGIPTYCTLLECVEYILHK